MVAATQSQNLQISNQASLGNLIEALTALELNSEASRLHLTADLPDLFELRRLNSSALRDVGSILSTIAEIRKIRRAQ